MYKYLLCMRYLSARKIGWFSIISVMLGVATLIVVNSVMGGFHQKMRERLRGILADVIVESTTLDGFSDPDLVMEKVREVAGDDLVAVEPVVDIFAMFSAQNRGQGQHLTRPIKLIGTDPKARAQVGDFAEYLQDPDNQQNPSFEMTESARQWRQAHPDLVDLNAPPPAGAIVGHQIAFYRSKRFNEQGVEEDVDIPFIEPGQEIIITTVAAGRPKPVDDRLMVVDVFRSEMSEYDANYVFVPIERLQALRGMGHSITALHLKIRDYSKAYSLVSSLQEILPRMYFHVQTWEDKQGPLLSAVKVEKALLNVILSFIIAVAGFGILAIFFMIVVEKTRDIGILKAVGASSGDVMQIFLGYALVLGTVGSVLGTVFGILFSVYINQIEYGIKVVTGYELFPKDIYYFDRIPTYIETSTVVGTVIFAMLIAVGAAVLPARRAAKLRPVEALRWG